VSSGSCTRDQPFALPRVAIESWLRLVAFSFHAITCCIASVTLPVRIDLALLAMDRYGSSGAMPEPAAIRSR
jgi:hypothetical protein